MTTTFVVIGLITIVLIFFLSFKLAINKSVKKIKSPPATIPHDSVQCFSCGMVVPVEKALKKKGRYFCGVKRNDRNGNPVVKDKDESPQG
jgi:hypothetical protein